MQIAANRLVVKIQSTHFMVYLTDTHYQVFGKGQNLRILSWSGAEIVPPAYEQHFSDAFLL